MNKIVSENESPADAGFSCHIGRRKLLMARNYHDLPYYPIHDPLVMTNEDFMNAVQEMLPQVRRGMSVMSTPPVIR